MDEHRKPANPIEKGKAGFLFNEYPQHYPMKFSF